MHRANIKPELIRWACERSGETMATLTHKFPKLEQWLSGKVSPTRNQLEDLSSATLTALGYFFLSQPPVDKLPVPDFRTVNDRPVKRPSAALLETIHAMQRRQGWMHDYLIEEGAEPIPFIGSVTRDADPARVAEDIRKTLGIGNGWAINHRTWEDALLGLRRAAENIDILIVINGIFENNTHKTLNPEEFRGFVLCDSYAPLIFINGADAKSAQMFTLAHELAHLWLGEDGVFNLPDLRVSSATVEEFCNKVAAEVLIPTSELLECWPIKKEKPNPFLAIAQHFKVSPIVAARRALDARLISEGLFFQFLRAYKTQEANRRRSTKKSSGGDFYKNQENRIGRRFGLAVVQAAKEGRLLYRDAYQLTGLSGKTFDRYAEKLTEM